MPLPREGVAPPPEDHDAGVPASSVLVVGSHEALFAPEPPRCDACGVPLPAEPDDEGYRVTGEGAYLWTRGDEIRVELVPLCTSCSAAIGVAAMARWEIEEEEG